VNAIAWSFLFWARIQVRALTAWTLRLMQCSNTSTDERMSPGYMMNFGITPLVVTLGWS
jgi:hypothetical protein